MNSLRKVGYAVFLIGSILLLAVPFVTFLLDRSTETIENKELKPLPEFVTADTGINVDYLSEMGAYFEERFPLRSLLISLDVDFNEALFGESGITDVVCGDDDWLYYFATLNDYMGLNQLDETGVASYVYDLSYVKDYVDRQTGGAQVLFTIPPNKNSVYPTFMPWRYLRDTELHVAQKIQDPLAARGVNYVDLVSLYSDVPQFATEEEPFLYYKRDSHWTSYGALPAYEAVMDGLGKAYKKYGLEDVQWGERSCDLENMINPGEGITSYVPNVLLADTELVRSTTTDSGMMIDEFESPGEGNLVLFGDSFRWKLIEPLSSNFRHSTAYQFGPVFDLEELLSQDIDVVVFERVERNLEKILEGITFPAEEMESPVGLSGVEMVNLAVEVKMHGSYCRLQGAIDGPVSDPRDIMDGCIGLELRFADGSTRAFKALRGIDNDSGSFYADIPQDVWGRGVQSMRAFATDAQGNVVSVSSSSL